jgi:hypothetical protein
MMRDGWPLKELPPYVEALQPPAACAFGKPHVERKPPATGHLGLRWVK